MMAVKAMDLKAAHDGDVCSDGKPFTVWRSQKFLAHFLAPSGCNVL